MHYEVHDSSRTLSPLFRSDHPVAQHLSAWGSYPTSLALALMIGTSTVNMSLLATSSSEATPCVRKNDHIKDIEAHSREKRL
jgi:hypothetical protein